MQEIGISHVQAGSSKKLIKIKPRIPAHEPKISNVYAFSGGRLENNFAILCPTKKNVMIRDKNKAIKAKLLSPTVDC